MPILLVSIIFLSLAVGVFSALYLIVSKRAVVKERLEEIAPPQEAVQVLEKPLTPLQKFLSRIGQKLPLRPEEQGKYAKMLVAAGIRPQRLPVFIGLKLFLAAALPAAYLFLYAFAARQERLNMVLISAALAIIGFILPSVQLHRMVKARQLRIFHDLPDVLDLMTICVESGLSMEGAMLRISEDRQFRQSPLAKEMKIALQETRAGKPRHEALRDMGERTMLDDMKAFCAMLIQTEKLGTSLAQSLRVHADSLRTIRRQRAEELAAKTAIKLLFPLVFLIMPAIFVVVLLPAVLKIKQFFGAM